MASPAPPPQQPPRSPDPAPVTDFALIESQKENIRPLAGGRSAATLGALFEKGSEAERILQEGVERLQAQVDAADACDADGRDMPEGVVDVLDAYSKYISFLVQHFPASPARVLPHLESTTRRFVDDSRFAQDSRYLKLWTLYARQVERREEVWSFLESRSIGTAHAAFYEEWATSLEGLGRKKKADDVYRLGIARRVAPLERLKNRHQAFLTRIMAPPSGVLPDDPPEPTPQPARRRTVLGQVGRGGSTPAQSAPSTSRPMSSARNGSKMAIFDDGAAAPEQPETTPWEDMGTRDGRRKENTVEATPWKGETLKQGRSIAPRTPKLEVFKDAGASAAVTHSAEGVLGGLKSKPPQSEAELLRADPLRHFDTASVQTTVPQIPILPAPPSTRKPPAKKQRREKTPVAQQWECPTEGAETMVNNKMQRRMFDWDATFRGGDEWSFQEVRARKLGLLGRDYKELKDWERGWHKAGATTPKPVKVAPPRAPSPTLNTKLANEEVMSLFNQTIHGGKVRDADFSDDDDDDDDDDAEEADQVAALPTPLPPRHPPVAMMTPGGMVPPTPTPAPGRAQSSLPVFTAENAESENAPPRKLNIFADAGPGPQDENAGVSGSARKMNVFQQGTPARTALSSRTPLSGKPRSFAVFQEDAENEHCTPARNVFAQPQVLVPAPAPAAVRQPSPVPEVPEEPHGADEPCDENDDSRGHNLHYFGRFSTMTPITERTFEATMTTTRSRRVSALSDNDDDGDEGLAPAQAAHPHASELASVEEEDERSASHSRRASPVAAVAGTEEPRRFSGSRRVSEARRVSGSSRVSDTSAADASRRVSDPSASDTSRRDSSSRRDSASCRDSASRSDSRPHDSHDSRRDSHLQDTSRRHSESRRDSTTSSRSGPSSTGFDMPEDFTYHNGAVDAAAFGVPDGYTIHRKVETATTMMDRLEVIDHADASMRSVGDISVAADVPMAQVAAPADIPNPCDPEAVVSTLLQFAGPLSKLPRFHDRRGETAGRLPAMNKAAKARTRRSSAASLRASTAPVDDAYILDLGTQYEICSKLGEGGFGAVFLALDMAARDAADEDSDSDDDDDSSDHLVAVKVENPCALWEALVLDRVHQRVSAEVRASIILPRGLHAFADESYLLLDYSSQGTLLEVVNKATAWGISAGNPTPSAPDELLALFFVAELLRVVEGLHAADIIHGDLKIDNCLVRLAPVPASKWSAEYSASGSGGWSHKGVTLIDFGRAADLTLYPAGRAQRFVASWATDERDCAEMREGRAWSYETDYYGLAGIAYCLLFGRYIRTEVVDGRHKIDQPLKRYWQGELWTRLFDVLLNPGAHAQGALPITSELASIRADVEAYLAANCQKNGKSLKQLLKRIELKAFEARAR